MEIDSKSRQQVKNAFQALGNQLSELWDALEQYEIHRFDQPENNGGWSVNQVLAHLTIAEKRSMDYIKFKVQSEHPLPKVGIGTKLRFFLLKMILKAPLKYKMPKQLPDPPNNIGFNKTKKQFEENRSDFKSMLDTIPDDLLGQEIFKHPLLGRFSMLQTLGFMQDHVAHHLPQIKRILKGTNQ